MSYKLSSLFALSALSSLASFGLLAPGHARAGNPVNTSAFFTIDDAGLGSGNPDNIRASLGNAGFLPTTSGTITNSFPGTFSITVISENPGNLGAVNATFQYFEPVPLAPGASITVNYNIFEFTGGPLSDTLSMTLIGLDSGFENTRVEVHFLSDNEVLPLSPLSNALPLTETGAFQDLSAQTSAITHMPGFHVRFASDVEPVPLPSAVWSGAALLSAMGATTIIRRRRRLAVA